MLQQVRFRFVIKLMSFTHAGDGRQFDDGVKKKDGGAAQVQSIQRGKDRLPVIEASSMRGAMKAQLKQYGHHALAESLFGKDDIDEVGADGCLRLHTGFLENRTEMEKWPLMLPYWNSLKDRPFSFVLPGIRIDRDRGSVEKSYLYHLEMLPDGCRFAFSGTFLGTEDEFELEVGCLCKLLALSDGFELGGAAGYGFGRARLDKDSVEYEARMYNPAKKDFDLSKGRLDIRSLADEEETYVISLKSDGPYFILDPYRAQKDKDGPDMLALMRDGDTPVFLGKMLLQDLRRRSAWLDQCDWLENNHFDYQNLPVLDNPDKHLKKDEDPAATLTTTERLFGVAGWGKRVRVTGIELTWDRKCHEAQGIKLDVFTQAPIDSALIGYNVPAGLSVKIRLKLDEAGLETADKTHFEKVLQDLNAPCRQPRYGHATGTGYGRFVCSIEQSGGV